MRIASAYLIFAKHLIQFQFYYIDLRKHSFTVRVTKSWNSLPESVILADTMDTFKNQLDEFQKSQDMVGYLYNYKYDLTGIGLRSLNLLQNIHGFIVAI